MFLDLFAHFSIALITVFLNPFFSRSITASIVVPPGEQTSSLRTPGCFPVSNANFAEPNIDCSASLYAFALGNPNLHQPLLQ